MSYSMTNSAQNIFSVAQSPAFSLQVVKLFTAVTPNHQNRYRDIPWCVLFALLFEHIFFCGGAKGVGFFHHAERTFFYLLTLFAGIMPSGPMSIAWVRWDRALGAAVLWE